MDISARACYNGHRQKSEAETRKMKTLAKFLVGLVVAVLLFMGYYVLSSRLMADATVSITPATDRVEEYERIQNDVAAGLYEGLDALDTIDAYYFVTFSVNVRNFSLFPAEWAQLTARAEDGDALIFSSDSGPKDIPSFGSGAFSVTVFTRSRDRARSGWLEYYVFGRLHSLDVAYEPPV